MTTLIQFLRKEAFRVLKDDIPDPIDMTQFHLVLFTRTFGSRDGISFEEGDISIIAWNAEYPESPAAPSQDSGLAYSFRSQQLILVRKDAVELLDSTMPLPREQWEVYLDTDGECKGPTGWIRCVDVAQAIDLCQEFIGINSLSTANWLGGHLRHALTKEKLGRIDVGGVCYPDDPAADPSANLATLKR